MMRISLLCMLTSLCCVIPPGNARAVPRPIKSLRKFSSLDLVADVATGFSALSRQNAAEYQREADRIRAIIEECFMGGLHRHQDFDDALLEAAYRAIKYPNLCENVRLVPKWTHWMKKYQLPLEYDTRSDSDRFIAFIVDKIRRRGYAPEYLVNMKDIFGEVYDECWKEGLIETTPAERAPEEDRDVTYDEYMEDMTCVHYPYEKYTACWPRSEAQDYTTSAFRGSVSSSMEEL